MNRVIAWSRVIHGGALLLTFMFGASSLHAAEQFAPDDYRQQTHVFRLIVGAKPNRQFLRSFEELGQPSRSLIILLGDVREPIDNIPGHLEKFVERGGAVLIASDQRLVEGELEKGFRVGIDGRKLENKNKRDNDGRLITYRGQSECPFVDGDMDTSAVFKSGPTVFSSGDALPVATNLPSFLDYPFPWFREDKSLPAKAMLPEGCFYYLDEKKRLTHQFDRELPFAVGFQRGPKDKHGHLLVMADHSVFINQMMQQTDNGNAAFALRCINWLDNTGQRDQVLFVENGEIMGPVTVEALQELPVPPPAPKPSLNTLIGIVDQMIADLENPKQGDNHFYDQLTDHSLPSTWPRVLILSLTGALFFYGLSRLWRARHRPDLSGPPLALAVARAAPGDNPIDRRYQALIQTGNLWEPARMLTRSFFDTLLAVPAGRPGPTRLPPLHVKPRGLRGWLLGQRIRRMWRFAHQPQLQQVSFRQFRKLARRVADLKDKAAQGLFRFSPLPPPSVARKLI